MDDSSSNRWDASLIVTCCVRPVESGCVGVVAGGAQLFSRYSVADAAEGDAAFARAAHHL